jgi:5,10-methenyltetrahydromethanopterin hydrogenase
MSIKELQSFFEAEGFNVHLFKQDNKQCAEIEKWTDGGVDMLIVLMPFSKNEFIEYVNDFDVDEQIDLHRQGEQYKNAFKISESVKDFTDFHNSLKDVVAKF